MRYTESDIRAAVEAWRVRLGFIDWTFRVTVGRIKGGHRATTTADFEYLTADLSFDPAAMDKAGDDLHEMVRHEIAHVPNWELAYLAERYAGKDAEKQDRVEKALERATTLTERMAHRLTGDTP